MESEGVGSDHLRKSLKEPCEDEVGEVVRNFAFEVGKELRKGFDVRDDEELEGKKRKRKGDENGKGDGEDERNRFHRLCNLLVD